MAVDRERLAMMSSEWIMDSIGALYDLLEKYKAGKYLPDCPLCKINGNTSKPDGFGTGCCCVWTIIKRKWCLTWVGDRTGFHEPSIMRKRIRSIPFWIRILTNELKRR